jgi:hypothetical protein
MQEAQDTITLVGIIRTGDKRQLARDKRRLNHDLGEVVRSWALLHDELAKLFHHLAGCDWWLAYPIWHAIKSDLSQRDMLLALASAHKARLEHFEDPDGGKKIAALEEIKWMLNETTRHSHRRNDLVHAPIIFKMDLDTDEWEARVSEWTNNPRAIKLADTELFQYCSQCIAFAGTMKAYAQKLTETLAGQPLPKRPPVPHTSQFPTRKQRIRQSKRKSLPEELVRGQHPTRESRSTRSRRPPSRLSSELRPASASRRGSERL